MADEHRRRRQPPEPRDAGRLTDDPVIAELARLAAEGRAELDATDDARVARLWDAIEARTVEDHDAAERADAGPLTTEGHGLSGPIGAPRSGDVLVGEGAAATTGRPRRRGADAVGVGGTRPTRPRRRPGPQRSSGPTRVQRAGMALAALAAAAAAVAVVVVPDVDGATGTQVALAPLEADAQPATAVVDAAARQVRLDADLPPVEGFYEVWLLESDGQGVVSLGPLRDDGTYAIPPGLSLASYDTVDVSVEPADGDPTHSGRSVLRGVADA